VPFVSFIQVNLGVQEATARSLGQVDNSINTGLIHMHHTYNSSAGEMWADGTNFFSCKKNFQPLPEEDNNLYS
jgi:hypothetical protein